MSDQISIRKRLPRTAPAAGEHVVWNRDAASVLAALPVEGMFDLTVTSPPYNIGKAYESRASLEDYAAQQTKIIRELVSRTRDTGSICWQVGNYVENGYIAPLDYIFHPIFTSLGLKL